MADLMLKTILLAVLSLPLIFLQGCGGQVPRPNCDISCDPLPNPLPPPPPVIQPPSGAITAAQVFSRSMIGQVWHFQDGFTPAHNLWITVEDAPVTNYLPAGCVQWKFSKDSFHGYWGPENFSDKTILWFVLCPQVDGAWASVASLISAPDGCSWCGTTRAFTLDVQVVPGNPVPYTIIPTWAAPGQVSGSPTAYRPYWGFDVLTYTSLVGSVAPFGDVSWETDTTQEQVTTPLYSGIAMSSDQREGPCTHEHWDFAPGLGLVVIQPLVGDCGQVFDSRYVMRRVP